MMTTVAQFRAYNDQAPSGAGVDAKITDVLDRAEGIVVAALGFAFFDSSESWAATSATEQYVRSSKSKYLKLPPYLYGSITSIKPMTGSGDEVERGDAITNYDETESRFYLYRESGWGGGRWAVTAKYGYGPAPAQIVELVLELAVNIWRQKAQGLFQQTQGVDSVGNAVGGGSIKYIGGLNADQRRIVANTRREYIDMVH